MLELYSPVTAKIYLLKDFQCHSVLLFYSPATSKVYLFAETHRKVTTSWTVLIGSIHNHSKMEKHLQLDTLIIFIAFTAGVTFCFLIVSSQTHDEKHWIGLWEDSLEDAFNFSLVVYVLKRIKFLQRSCLTSKPFCARSNTLNTLAPWQRRRVNNNEELGKLQI